ncbi:C40 family peptidase [Sphingomonas sp. Leaf231]|uniref:C40 family peptidase n=1 Tax=Sphingomonas sp. Leaf231 TaxID=1736301 RepID=UPI0009EBB541|nr:NlpC/P60 family protein [Sphingomonas sp. Leaf231]
MNREDFKSACKAELGKPYIWGKDGPDSYDCSGFAQWALGKLGLDKRGDQSANGLYQHFSDKKYGTIVVARKDADVGDVVFYGRKGRATHVAIGWGSGLMIEAGGGGSKMKTIDQARAAKACVRVRPITRRKDVMAIIRPNSLPW